MVGVEKLNWGGGGGGERRAGNKYWKGAGTKNREGQVG